MIHHRTPEFSAILDRAREQAKPLFGTGQDVILLASSGSGAMEAAVTNLLSPGEHAAFINGGKFGERWGKILNAYGMAAHEIKVEWGRAADPEQVARMLRERPEVRAIFVQACETSTCTVHPVREIAELTRSRDVLLIVDGITSVGVFEQGMDEWGVDALLTGSQKALMLPPGLAMIALSNRALERAKAAKSPRFYFDLPRELKVQRQDHTTAWTAAVSLVLGLNKSLEMIHAETLPRVFARHRLMAEAVRAAGLALDLKPVAPDAPAPGVSGLLVPGNLDGARVVRHMRDVLGVSVQGGQDQMKGKLVRIGLMGHVGPFDMLVAVVALEIALHAAGHRFQSGAGVQAVQSRLAQELQS
jgi:aspartate aminotransferase-like enzyme